MLEGWDFYFCDLNDARAAITVDLGLRAKAPDAKRPWRLWLTVELQDAGPVGLGGAEDADYLQKLEAKLKTAARKLSATYAGRIRRAGKWEFFLYGKSVRGFAEAMQDLMAKFPEYRFATGSEQDPGWMFYLNVLYPNHVDIHQIHNRRIIARLREQGDELIKGRPVEHWLAFPSEASRQTFIDQVKPERFTVRQSYLRDPCPDGRPFGVQIVRRDFVDQHAMDAVVGELIRKADALDGDYGGWSAAVAT